MEDTHLPFNLRAAFCKIMQCVHLDIYPQEQVNPVKYARLWEDIQAGIVVKDYCPWLMYGKQLLSRRVSVGGVGGGYSFLFFFSSKKKKNGCI